MGIANHLFVVYVLYMIIYDKTAKTLSLKLQHKIKTAHATDTHWDQPLIPSQKVRSTGQLVEKILGRSSENSYHESGGKLEFFGLKHI